MSSEITSLITFVESYLIWLSSMSGKLATLILFIAFVVLSALELNYPKRRLSLHQSRQSYQTNVGLFVFNSLIVSLLSATPLLMMAEPLFRQRIAKLCLQSGMESPAVVCVARPDALLVAQSQPQL